MHLLDSLWIANVHEQFQLFFCSYCVRTVVCSRPGTPEHQNMKPPVTKITENHHSGLTYAVALLVIGHSGQPFCLQRQVQDHASAAQFHMRHRTRLFDQPLRGDKQVARVELFSISNTRPVAQAGAQREGWSGEAGFHTRIQTRKIIITSGFLL